MSDIYGSIILTSNYDLDVSKHMNAYEITSYKKICEMKNIKLKVVDSRLMTLYHPSKNQLPLGVINLSGYPSYFHHVFLQMLEDFNVPSLNKVQNSIIADDKIFSYNKLLANNYKVLKTISLNLSHSWNLDYVITKIGDMIGFPCVVKMPDTGFGWGIVKINSAEELNDHLGLWLHFNTNAHHGNSNYKLIVQEFLPNANNNTVRVIYLNGQCLGASSTLNNNNWKVNLRVNGAYREKYIPNTELIDLTDKICKLFELEFCGIDYYINGDDYIVAELNPTSFHKGFEIVNPEICLAEKIIDYMLTKISDL